MFLPGMSNVLAEDKRQQVLALGRLGWSLRRIERATGVRRETASNYLKAAGVVVRGRGRPRTSPSKPAISSEVSTDSAGTRVRPGAGDAASVSGEHPSRAPRASACEPYRELIAEAVGRGRNAMAIWQDLVDDHGFPAGYASVRPFVSTLRRQPTVEARAVIATAPGGHYVESRVMLSSCTRGRSGEPFHASWPPRTSHNSYRDSSHSRRSLESRRGFGPLRTGVPTRSKASRFITRSLWT